MDLVLSALGAAASLVPWGLAHRCKTWPENLLKHPLRKRIFETVESNPGIRLSDLCRRLETSRGSAQYHLYLMERAGLLRGFARGKARRFFLPDHPFEDVVLASLLSHQPARNVAERILERPGIMQKDLAQSTGLSAKSVRSYVRLLRHDGLLMERSDARSHRYHPTELLRHALGLAHESKPPSKPVREPPADSPARAGGRKPRRPEAPLEGGGSFS